MGEPAINYWQGLPESEREESEMFYLKISSCNWNYMDHDNSSCSHWKSGERQVKEGMVLSVPEEQDNDKASFENVVI